MFRTSLRTRSFQSTLPAGGATFSILPPIKSILISIHAPRGGSDFGVVLFCILFYDFNPRSPRGERPQFGQQANGYPQFQSTLPAGGATLVCLSWKSNRPYFNPRSPRGERRKPKTYFPTASRFQSTLPAGGATLPITFGSRRAIISIHAPRGGSDVSDSLMLCPARISIHAPRGGSDHIVPRMALIHTISIHAPRGGSDHNSNHGCFRHC